MKKLFFLLLFLLLGASFTGALYFNDLSRPAAKEEMIVVKKGDNITSLANTLKKKGLLQYRWPLQLHGYSTGQHRHMQTGVYKLKAGMNARELLADIAAGKVAAYRFTVVEGKTYRDLLKALRGNEHLQQTLAGKSPEEIAQLLNLPANPEGLFLPETYYFSPNSSDLDLLKRINGDLNKYLNEAWAKRAPGLPYKTPQEALIMASIVEKETALAAERPLIAGVFVRRLQQGMKLQTDPTVIYGAKDYQGVITKKHLQTDTPYNTYTRDGLPPTAIALASKAAIDAALHPTAGDALYFVADGSGGHKFSRTYEEHEAAVQKYRQLEKQAKASVKASSSAKADDKTPTESNLSVKADDKAPSARPAAKATAPAKADQVGATGSAVPRVTASATARANPSNSAIPTP